MNVEAKLARIARILADNVGERVTDIVIDGQRVTGKVTKEQVAQATSLRLSNWKEYQL